MVQTIDLNGNKPDSGASPAGCPGEATADRLVAAATELFVEQGYNAVSTRALARAAGVNLSAITYHFGGKKGLYQAAIQRVLDHIAPIRNKVFADLARALDAAGDDPAALALLVTEFVGNMVRAQLNQDLGAAGFQLLIRETQNPNGDLKIVMDQHFALVEQGVASLVAKATGRSMDDLNTRIMALVILGQSSFFITGRLIALNLMDWQEYSAENIEKLASAIAPAIVAMLGLPAVENIAGRPEDGDGKRG